MGRACSIYGAKLNAYRILMGNSEGNKPLEIYKLRREDNNKMDLKEIGLVGMDWIDLAQDRDYWSAHMKTVMNLRGQ
jgi:hypothetical protein